MKRRAAPKKTAPDEVRSSTPRTAVILGDIAGVVVAAVPTALALWIADGVDRGARAQVNIAGLLVILASITPWLFVSAAVAVGVSRLAGRAPRFRRAILGAVPASLVTLALAPALRASFSGERAKASLFGTLGPGAALTIVWLGTLVLVLLATFVLDRHRDRSSRLPLLLFVASLLGGGCLLLYVDRTVLVSLYVRLHQVLEMVGAMLLAASASLAWRLVPPREAHRIAIPIAGVLGLGSALLFGRSGSEEGLMRFLPELEKAPLYVQRALLRDAALLVFFRGDSDGAGWSPSGIDALLDRYDIPRASRDPIWDAPFAEAPEVDAVVERLRADEPASVIVFYVDTLRRDVAYDEATMPNVARFAKESVVFDRAYASGAETLTVLPGIVGGHYDLRRVLPDEPGVLKGSFARPTILDLARDNHVGTTLVIPESAFEFLKKLMPSFAFAETLRFSDYERSGVWGYGAETSSAEALVSLALDALEKKKDDPSRSLTWIFNFDVHNWRQLDKVYIATAAQRFGMVDDGSEAFSYRVAARGVDEAFGRFLAGIDDLGLRDKTAIFFVADHGEALGERDFWVHSVFLWESIVRVPLIFRAPRLTPAKIEAPVSVIDLAPTIARYIHPPTSMNGFHGEDLVSYAAGPRPKRRLPLLMSAMREKRLGRVGLVDDRYKLVLRTDWDAPQLYDLTIPQTDETDLGATQPDKTMELLNILLSSPVFVNAYEDAKELERQGDE